MTEQLFAIGKLGGPVRTLFTGLKADAFVLAEADEVVCLLHTKPEGPTMILADGSDVVPIPLTLRELKDHMCTWVKKRREDVLSSGCDTPFGRVDSNLKSRTNIFEAAQDATFSKVEGLSFSERWRMEDNSYQTFDADQMLAVAQALRQFKSAIYAVSFAFSARIEACETQDDLEKLDPSNIVWP